MTVIVSLRLFSSPVCSTTISIRNRRREWDAFSEKKKHAHNFFLLVPLSLPFFLILTLLFSISVVFEIIYLPIRSLLLLCEALIVLFKIEE